MPLSSATWRSGVPASATIARPSMCTVTGFLKALASVIVAMKRNRSGHDLLRPVLEEVRRRLLAVDVGDRPARALERDPLLELQEPVDDGLRARRAARDVDVDRDDRVDALHDGVVVVRAARVRAVAEREHPLRVRHLLPDPAEDRGLAMRDRSDDQKQIRLARREAGQRHAKAVGVEARTGDRHVLHAAARGDERILEERVLPRPRERVLVARGDERVARVGPAGPPVGMEELFFALDGHALDPGRSAPAPPAITVTAGSPRHQPTWLQRPLRCAFQTLKPAFGDQWTMTPGPPAPFAGSMSESHPNSHGSPSTHG